MAKLRPRPAPDGRIPGEISMRFSTALMLPAFFALIGSGGVFAQTVPATKPTAADLERKAIAKACADQAKAQNLHGKEKKTFRVECKKNGGKPV
jgi:hypothetical protein